MPTAKAKAEEQKDPNELVVMKHKGITKTAQVTRRQFEKLHKKKGWEEVQTGEDGALPDGTPPLINSDNAPAQADTDTAEKSS